MNSEKIEITGAGFRYFAHVGQGLLKHAGELVREVVRGQRAVIMTDANSPRALHEAVATSLGAARFKVSTIVIPPGEHSKSLREVERVCGAMSGADRSSVVVGLGGGVVGDLSGFVAAIFHRGIAHVQIPTTLLAMVDSAIGGKNGVNLAAGKNLVGAIHHPSLIIADVEVLKTLPTRELRQGYAEIVKHAVIRDAEMFDALSARPEEGDRLAACPPSQAGSLTSSSRAEMSEMERSGGSRLKRDASESLHFARDDAALIARNIRIKAAVVAADDRDVSGVRAVLNFGHTVGHGIERASDFQIPHGDCVSVGMVAACNISVRRAGLPAAERDRVIELLGRLHLPTRWPSECAREKVFGAIMQDKKFEGGEVRFVVIPRIGEAYVSREVTLDDIGEAIENL